MTFVNESATEQDVEKYELRDSNRKFGRDVDGAYEWTINRATGTYLRYHSYNHQVQGEENFLFCRDGCVDYLVLIPLLGPIDETPRKVTWSFDRRVISAGKPIDQAYLADLRAALATYQLSGLHGSQERWNVLCNF
jgi:hypothetical protein